MEADLTELVQLLNQRPGVPKLKVPRGGDLGHVNINSGSCQEAEPGSSGSRARSIGAALGSWLRRRPLAVTAQQPTTTEVQPDSSPSASTPPPPATEEGNTTGRTKGRPDEWEPRRGTLNLCDKDAMFKGQYRHCFDSLSRFYAEDLRLLHGQ